MGDSHFQYILRALCCTAWFGRWTAAQAIAIKGLYLSPNCISLLRF